MSFSQLLERSRAQADSVKYPGAQHPLAVVLACSDSRVPVELIFGAKPGEIFVIRTAGNTAGVNELASIEYAVEHLGVKLVIALGHSHCGAVAAALEPSDGHSHGGKLEVLINAVRTAIGNAKDAEWAEVANASYSAEKIKTLPCIKAHGVEVVAARYEIENGQISQL
ncbi:MAG: carbonic anhydrase [Oscillospiraceae bacterium]|nr:carbonic anhydrase [Oscillospiraceae bacterium]